MLAVSAVPTALFVARLLLAHRRPRHVQSLFERGHILRHFLAGVRWETTRARGTSRRRRWRQILAEPPKLVLREALPTRVTLELEASEVAVVLFGGGLNADARGTPAAARASQVAAALFAAPAAVAQAAWAALSTAVAGFATPHAPPRRKTL